MLYPLSHRGSPCVFGDRSKVPLRMEILDPDAGKDRRQEEKGTTEDEMVVWHHPLNGMSLG